MSSTPSVTSVAPDRPIPLVWVADLRSLLVATLVHPRRLVAGLTVLALLLRAWDVQRMSIWQDEGLTLYRAGLDWAGILSGQIPLDALVTQDLQPPLYFLLVAGWLRALDLPVGQPGAIWAGTWLSLLVSLPAIPLSWALARRLLRSPLRWLGSSTSDEASGDPAPAGTSAAATSAAAVSDSDTAATDNAATNAAAADTAFASTVAALLAAISPALLWYSQELRSYSLQVTLGLMAVYALLRALEAWDRPDSPRSTSLPWALGCLLSNAALVWTHYLSVFLLGFQALVLLAFGLRRRDWRPLIPLLVVGLAAAPLLPYALWRLGIGAERDQHFVPLRTMLRDVSFGLGFGRTAEAWSLDAPARGLGMLAAELAFAGSMVFGFHRLWRAHRRGTALVAAGYLLLPVLGLYALTWIKPVYMGIRHILLAMPAGWILAGCGLVAAERRRAGLGAGLLLLAAIGMLASDRNFYTDPAYAKDDHRAVANYVRQRAVIDVERPDLLLVPHPVLQHTYRPLLLDRGSPEVQTMPPFLPSGLPDDRPPGELLGPLLAAHQRLWFVDPPGELQDWLEHNAVEVDRRDFPASSIVLDLRAYERAPALDGEDAPTRRQNLRLGALTLLGWDTRPGPLVAGAGGRLRLIWKVEERERPDYKVAVELLDAEGRAVMRSDHAPFHGLRPSSGWDFGSTVYDPQDLMPSAGLPSGSYRLTLRLYEAESGEAYPPEGPAELGEVEVVQAQAPAYLSRLGIEHSLRARSGPVDMIGFDLPRPETGGWTSGSRLPLAVWIEKRSAIAPGAADAAGDAASAISGTLDFEGHPTATETLGPMHLRAELLDRWGRVAASTEIALPIDRTTDRYWRLPLAFDLPARAGRYDLRVKLLNETGRPRMLWRGEPLSLLPARGVWLSSLAVRSPERVTRAPQMQHRVGATVGGMVELLGYDGPAAELAAGQTHEIPVTLYWRGLAPMSTRYQVTLQLLPAGPDGQPAGPPIAQADGEPAAGTRPTTGWAPGEVVVDARSLTLPETMPAGDYLLIAALYDPQRPELPRPEVEQGGSLLDYALLQRIRFGEPGSDDAAPAELETEEARIERSNMDDRTSEASSIASPGRASEGKG